MKKAMFFLSVFIFFGTLLGFGEESNKKEKLHMLLFYSKHCGACMKVENQILPPLLKQYGKYLDLTQKEIIEDQALEELMIYNPKGTVPTLIVAGKIFIGSDDIQKNLEPIIKDFIAGKIENNTTNPEEINKKKQ